MHLATLSPGVLLQGRLLSLLDFQRPLSSCLHRVLINSVKKHCARLGASNDSLLLPSIKLFAFLVPDQHWSSRLYASALFVAPAQRADSVDIRLVHPRPGSTTVLPWLDVRVLIVTKKPLLFLCTVSHRWHCQPSFHLETLTLGRVLALLSLMLSRVK